jgi:hypothetical protein
MKLIAVSLMCIFIAACATSTYDPTYKAVNYCVVQGKC